MPSIPVTLSWPTAGKRDSLIASIRSLLQNGKEAGYWDGTKPSPTVFISSDNIAHPDTGFEPSLYASLQDLLRDHGADTSPTFHISTVQSRTRFISELSKKFDPQLLEFALLPPQGVPGWGVNVNASFLYSAGGKLISIDDDVLAQPAVSKHNAKLNVARNVPFHPNLKNPTYSTDFLQSPLYYYANRAELLLDIDECALDVIGAYQAAVGDFEAGRVLMVNAGLYGDTAMGSARGVLSLGGRSRGHIVRKGYEAVKTSRELVRISESFSVSPSVHFIAASFGADNRVPLAPFMPQGRNTDGLASLINRIVYMGSLNGYLPFGLLHLPEGLSYPHPISHYSLSICDLFTVLALATAPDSSVVEPQQRMQYLARQFMKCANLPSGQFVETIHACWSHHFKSIALDLRRLLDEHSRTPIEWAQDVDAHLAALEYVMRNPMSLFGDGGCGLSVSRSHDLLFMYGALLDSWFDIWEESKAYRMLL